MPLTDITELMDQMNRLLAAAPPLPGGAGDSPGTVAAPMQEINALPRSFAQVYGTGQGMLVQLAKAAEAQGDTDLAKLLRALDQGLRGGAFDLDDATVQDDRFSGFEYPVV